MKDYTLSDEGLAMLVQGKVVIKVTLTKQQIENYRTMLLGMASVRWQFDHVNSLCDLALTAIEPSDELVEEAAKKLCAWIGYAWEGAGERDISSEYPDWCSNGRMQGGKPALRKIARAMLRGIIDVDNG